MEENHRQFIETSNKLVLSGKYNDATELSDLSEFQIKAKFSQWPRQVLHSKYIINVYVGKTWWVKKVA